jgi:hypothetical protein
VVEQTLRALGAQETLASAPHRCMAGGRPHARQGRHKTVWAHWRISNDGASYRIFVVLRNGGHAREDLSASLACAYLPRYVSGQTNRRTYFKSRSRMRIHVFQLQTATLQNSICGAPFVNFTCNLGRPVLPADQQNQIAASLTMFDVS